MWPYKFPKLKSKVCTIYNPTHIHMLVCQSTVHKTLLDGHLHLLRPNLSTLSYRPQEL